jgi:capsular exopolysaccharide synthesis family protein
MASEARTLTAPVPPALTDAPTTRALLLALRRRWLLASVCAVLGAAAAGAGTWFGMPPPQPTAQSLLYVEAQPPAVVYQRGESRNDFQSYQRTQVALVKSRLVLNTALRDPEVAALPMVRQPIDPVTWLQKEMLVDFSIAPEILRIALTGHDPEQMQVVVAKITRAYLDEIVKREEGKRRDRLEKLKELHERYQENLRTKRRTLRGLVENVGSGDPQTIAIKQRFAQEQLAMAEKELLQVDSELRKLQTDLAVRKGREGLPEDWKLAETELDELARKDPQMERLVARKAQLNQDIADALRVAVKGEDEPRIQRLRNELAEVDKGIAKRREELRPALTAQIQQRYQRNHQANLTALAERGQALAELRKTLAQDIERLSTETRSLNKGSLDIESYKQDIAQTEETGRKIAAELEALTVEQKAVPRVTELESAFISQPDDFRRRALASLAAMLGGLVLAAWGVAWWEHRSRRIQSSGEVVHGLGIKLLGTVPALPPAQPPVMDSLRTDALDATRAMLLHTARTQSLRVVLVTSAVAGEGKTSLASRLASSLARANRRTLLIDCDLRNPSVHRLFQVPAGPGVSEVLTGAALAEEVIQPTAIPGLALIAAGEARTEALQSLAWEKGGLILDPVRELFDFVIVDSSPVLPVADSLLLAQQVDGAVLSLLHDVSQMPKVHAAHAMMTEMGIRVLGAVLNGVDGPAYGPEYRAVPAEPVAAPVEVA